MTEISIVFVLVAAVLLLLQLWLRVRYWRRQARGLSNRVRADRKRFDRMDEIRAVERDEMRSLNMLLDRVFGELEIRPPVVHDAVRHLRDHGRSLTTCELADRVGIVERQLREDLHAMSDRSVPEWRRFPVRSMGSDLWQFETPLTVQSLAAELSQLSEVSA